jgi:putative serine/threonine protein kinase
MLTLENLFAEPYASIVCYPRARKMELRKRIGELRKLGVEGLDFVGEKRILNVPVLGKGCVGIVVLTYGHCGRAALKIRRVDADRSRMQQEAKLLQRANSVGVGPKLLRFSRNFLLMEFIEGVLLIDWLKTKRSRILIRKVLREILEQCWSLDRIGLDHGELSHAPKHVMVSKEDKPAIVDFESASLNRRPSNVTSICQFLFLGDEPAKILAKKLGTVDRETVFEALRRYKNDRTFENFETVLTAFGL